MHFALGKNVLLNVSLFMVLIVYFRLFRLKWNSFSVGLFNIWWIFIAFHVLFIFTDFFYSHILFFSVASRLDLEPLKYMYAMAFAVEEINRNSTLLPGVKLGYHILDSCSRYPWALGAAMSLVGGDTYSCNLSDAATHSAYQQSGETKGMMI